MNGLFSASLASLVVAVIWFFFNLAMLFGILCKQSRWMVPFLISLALLILTLGLFVIRNKSSRHRAALNELATPAHVTGAPWAATGTTKPAGLPPRNTTSRLAPNANELLSSPSLLLMPEPWLPREVSIANEIVGTLHTDVH